MRPFEDDGEGRDDNGGNDVSINGENVMVHALLKTKHRDNIHPCISKLQGNHS